MCDAMWERLRLWWETISGGPRDARQARGAAGERAAEAFLKGTYGYGIVARNWRNPRDRREEIDLVCRDGEALVFVEVKTRAAGALIGGYHAVDRKKKVVLRRATAAYLRGLGRAAQPLTVRFDIVEVEWAHEPEAAPIVRHFENVRLWLR